MEYDRDGCCVGMYALLLQAADSGTICESDIQNAHLCEYTEPAVVDHLQENSRLAGKRWYFEAYASENKEKSSHKSIT